MSVNSCVAGRRTRPAARCCCSGNHSANLLVGVAAPGRILVAANLRRHPHAALAVEHRIVRIGRVVRRIGPQMLVAPMQRRTARCGKREGTFSLRLARRNVERVRGVLVRIQHDELAVAGRDRVDASVRVHGRVILVGRHFVVHERMVVADIPQRHDQVPLDALRPRRRRRHLALGDALGPVGIDLRAIVLCPDWSARRTSTCRGRRCPAAIPRPRRASSVPASP